MNDTLPALAGGSPKMIEQADADRYTWLTRLDEQLRAGAGPAPTDAVDEMIALYREVALRQTDIGWWLNNHHKAPAPIIGRLFTADDRARLAAIAGKR